MRQGRAINGRSLSTNIIGLVSLAGVAILLMSGCSSTGKKSANNGVSQVERPERIISSPAERHGGHTLDTYPSLFSDHKPSRVGESVTVLILEEASSSTSADTSTSKSTGFAARLQTNSSSNSADLSLENNSAGAGAINREGRLVASVSATVEQILPTGELVIYGEQKIEFNNEVQHIRIVGHIRPEDISRDNTVLSSRISEAEITYKGDGLLGNRQKPGFITRTLNKLF